MIRRADWSPDLVWSSTDRETNGEQVNGGAGESLVPPRKHRRCGAKPSWALAGPFFSPSPPPSGDRGSGGGRGL